MFAKLKFLVILVLIAYKAYGDQDVIIRAFSNIEQGNFDHALTIIKQKQDHVVSKILMTRAILDNRCTEIGFDEATKFLQSCPEWPQAPFIKTHIEKLADPSVDSVKVFKWFSQNPPTTPIGHKKYALSIKDDLNKIEVEKIVKRGWIYGSFTKEEKDKFLKKYSKILTYADHLARVDELLWDSNHNEAKEMMHLINKSDQKLYLARIALLEKKPEADRLFKRLTHNEKLSSGVLYSYLKNKRFAKQPVTHQELHFASYIPSDKKRGDKWWHIRSYYVRELFDKHRYSQAYRLASNHYCKDRSNIVQAEWLAGWISLRFLHNAKSSLSHFKKLYSNCSRPISRARGAYWIARSYKSMQNVSKAKEWFSVAAKHGHTFYGQMAQYELGFKNLEIAKESQIVRAQQLDPVSREGIEIIKLLAEYDQKHLIKPYIESILAMSKNADYVSLVLDELNRTNSAALKVEAARQAAFYGVLRTSYAYPVLKDIRFPLIETPLIHSIIRQESSFDVSATDPTGGFGLMQLLLSTAKQSAKSLGMPYDKNKLLQNSEYNIMLGSKHLADHLEYYNGSYVLSIPAYNAGTHRVDDWIKRYGDPRKFKSIYRIIDWTESIPFSTTRDYIHRIIENLQVYKLLIRKNSRLSINEDLKYKMVHKNDRIAKR